MDQKPHHSSYTSFPILAISVLGILTTAVLLLSYYIFVIKCCLNFRRPNLLIFLSRSSRRLRSRRFSTPLPRHSPHLVHLQLPESRGLDSATINYIPTFRFTNSGTWSSIECAVCLADFQEAELLRLLPDCSHAFHIDCIDTWLQSNANCPLCRTEISSTPMQQLVGIPQPAAQQDSSVVIDIRTSAGSNRASEQAAVPVGPSPKSATKPRRFWQMASMGDECIDIREKDERFAVQPIRRSFSMDSSNDRQLYISVQEILRQNPALFQEVHNVRSGEGSSSGGGGNGGGNASGRIRRSFFSFGRSPRSASVLPVQCDQL